MCFFSPHFFYITAFLSSAPREIQSINTSVVQSIQHSLWLIKKKINLITDFSWAAHRLSFTALHSLYRENHSCFSAELLVYIAGSCLNELLWVSPLSQGQPVTQTNHDKGGVKAFFLPAQSEQTSQHINTSEQRCSKQASNSVTHPPLLLFMTSLSRNTAQ